MDKNKWNTERWMREEKRGDGWMQKAEPQHRPWDDKHAARREHNRLRKLEIEDNARRQISEAWDEAIVDIRAGNKNGLKAGYFSAWRRYFKEIVMPMQYIFVAAVTILAVVLSIGIDVNSEDFFVIYAVNPIKMLAATVGAVWLVGTIQLRYNSEERMFKRMLYECVRYDDRNEQDRSALVYILEEARLISGDTEMLMRHIYFSVFVFGLALFINDTVVYQYSFLNNPKDIYLPKIVGFITGLQLAALNFIYRLRIA